MSKYEMHVVNQLDPVYAGVTFRETNSIDEWNNARLYEGWYFCQLDDSDNYNQYSELNGPYSSIYETVNAMSKHFESYSMRGI
jgi:hypothetical protein